MDQIISAVGLGLIISSATIFKNFLQGGLIEIILRKFETSEVQAVNGKIGTIYFSILASGEHIALKPKSKVSHHDSNKKPPWKRDKSTAVVFSFEEMKQMLSQRQFCESIGVPRTTLQYWIHRKGNIDASPVVINFFEHPDGLAFLHRIMTAVNFVFNQNSIASNRDIISFLELSGISSFVASSYGSQQKTSKEMERKINEFGISERERMAKEMPKKKISLTEDETFHPKICIVGMDPDSGFIFLEKYVERRDSETWNQETRNALSGLPVEVIQVASDEARALINHVEKGLNANHSPDLFHVTQEVSKGTSVALSSKIKKAENEDEKAAKETQKQKEFRDRYDNQEPRPRGRRPDFEKRIEIAGEQKKQTEINLNTARENQEKTRSAKIGIGRGYHPYDPESGEKQDADKVENLLESCFNTIYGATQSLSERCKKRIDKAHRVLGKMKATIAFFFRMVDICIENINASAEERKLMEEYLIPGFYLEQVKRKEKDPERRERISEKSKELLSILKTRDGPYSSIDSERWRILEETAGECALIFQRSSSCVEGRNAHLSLHHQGMHRLSDGKLGALTVIHNYFKKRADGTTAAERFFCCKPKDLFEWLLENVSFPVRPRKRVALAS